MQRTDLGSLLSASLAVAPVPGVPELRLLVAHAGSRLGRLTVRTPYFAYPWAGGIALARHVLDNPDIVAGRRVLDLGAGSGLVGIAAARAGARVVAADTDAAAHAAIPLNAALNGVAVELLDGDPLAAAPPPVDMVLTGDVFYAPRLARRVAAFLRRCSAAGIPALVGDPGRAHLPLGELSLVARYRVADVGGGEREAGVYAFGARPD